MGYPSIIIIHSCNLLFTFLLIKVLGKKERQKKKKNRVEENKNYVIQSAARKLKIVLLLVILTRWRLCQEVKVESIHAGVPRVRRGF